MKIWFSKTNPILIILLKVAKTTYLGFSCYKSRWPPNITNFYYLDMHDHMLLPHPCLTWSLLFLMTLCRMKWDCHSFSNQWEFRKRWSRSMDTTQKLYLVSYGILCHGDNNYNDISYESLYKYCHPDLLSIHPNAWKKVCYILYLNTWS
jgi:hypothetical protein